MRGTHRSILSSKKRYLQVALNSTLEDAAAVIASLPSSDRILIEAGTPFIKRYGARGIRELRALWEARSAGYLSPELAAFSANMTAFGILGAVAGAHTTSRARIRTARPGEDTSPLYVVADMKTIDRGATEVEIAASGGASAAIAMGTAPSETLNAFIAACHAFGMDAMIDMMNVEYPVAVLSALKRPPEVVILHRGVDEERENKQKMLPLHEIRRVKGRHDILVAVAGGDTAREVQSAAFNDADIVVIWKSVYQKTGETSALVEGFLKTIK